MPPSNRVAPLLGVLLIVAIVVVAGVTLMPDGDDGNNAPFDTPEAPLPPHRAPRLDVAPHRCGVVTYTPRHAVQAQHGDLCRPGRTVRGAVILVHGGGGYSGDRSSMREWAGWYRDQGFVTLSIDYALLGDGFEPLYPLPENQLKAAVQWTRLQASRLGFDPQRILVHGSSAGARLAAQAYVTAGTAWLAGPNLWAGVPDDIAGMIGFYGYYDGDTLQVDRYYGGPPRSRDPLVRERWARADSVAQAGGATGPALLFHGDVDGLITVAQTERFGSALVEAGVDVTTYIVTEADHAFDGRFGDLTTESGRDAAAEIEDWLTSRFPA
jgi:acetyl esterase/lipase